MTHETTDVLLTLLLYLLLVWSVFGAVIGLMERSLWAVVNIFMVFLLLGVDFNGASVLGSYAYLLKG